MKIYTLKVTPQEKREVNRVIDISENSSLDTLCSAILDAIDFYHDHLYEFSLTGELFDEDNYQLEPFQPGMKTTREKIKSLNLSAGQKFIFHYDFGEDWIFEIEVKNIRENDVEIMPSVIESKGEIIQYPDMDEEFEEEDEIELTEDEQKLEKENNAYLKIFKNSMQKLKKSTIEQHLDNMDLYLNQFLLYRNGLSFREGPQEIDSFMRNFYITRCMWSTPSNIKTTAASIKKFYKLMADRGEIEKQVYQELVNTIKEEMEEWQEECRSYFEDDDEDDWSFY